MLPVEIVLAPAWWHYHEGITFDEDFFFHPAKRVEMERRMEQALYARWGRFGLGMDRDKDLPVVGAIHLAAGFFVSAMLGCSVEYVGDGPPVVKPAHRESLSFMPEEVFRGPPYKKLESLVDALCAKYGSLVGDINWGGVLNVALDLRGQSLFLDWRDRPDEARRFLGGIARVIERLTESISRLTGSTSVSVNRIVRHFPRPVYLHGEWRIR